jgi:DNA-directed RNA polymerase specialized sigma24 family protein
MRRVLKARLLDIERGARAAKRGGRYTPLSLDAVPGSHGEEGLTLEEVLPDEDPAGCPEQAAERLALRSHVERVLHLQSPRQRQLTEQLSAGASMSEAGRYLGIPRPTLYDELRRIKEGLPRRRPGGMP